MTVRLIPRLDIKGPNLVKGVNLEGLRVLGKPEDFARHYYEDGADELFYLDAVASLYGRNSLLEIVRKTAREIFIPLTVGGGLRGVEDIRAVLRAGADKVAINTAAIQRPQLIHEASRMFGSSTIVVSIAAIRKPDGGYEAFVDSGRERTGVDPFQWAVQAVELGAGELIVTSIDREGTGRGFDVELTSKIAASVPVPVIASGGAGDKQHVYQAIVEGKADAVGLASLLHYGHFRNTTYAASDFKDEGNIDYLLNRRSPPGIAGTDLPSLRRFLAERGIEGRPWNGNRPGR